MQIARLPKGILGYGNRAQLLKVEATAFPVRGPAELKKAFDKMVERRIEGVEISDDAMLNVGTGRLAPLGLGDDFLRLETSGSRRPAG